MACPEITDCLSYLPVHVLYHLQIVISMSEANQIPPSPGFMPSVMAQSFTSSPALNTASPALSPRSLSDPQSLTLPACHHGDTSSPPPVGHTDLTGCLPAHHPPPCLWPPIFIILEIDFPHPQFLCPVICLLTSHMHW